MNSTKPLLALILGAGGHAKVVTDSYLSDATSSSVKLIGAVDPHLIKGADWYREIPVWGEDNELLAHTGDEFVLINGIGQLPNDHGLRINIYTKLKQQGYTFQKVVDQSAQVSPTAILEDGVQLLARSVVQAQAYIGSNTIINTGAQVDHNCHIKEHCSVSPGAVLCGGVSLGRNVFVGANAVIIQNVEVGDGAVIAAGSIVTKNVEAGQTYISARR